MSCDLEGVWKPNFEPAQAECIAAVSHFCPQNIVNPWVECVTPPHQEYTLAVSEPANERRAWECDSPLVVKWTVKFHPYSWCVGTWPNQPQFPLGQKAAIRVFVRLGTVAHDYFLIFNTNFCRPEKILLRPRKLEKLLVNRLRETLYDGWCLGPFRENREITQKMSKTLNSVYRIAYFIKNVARGSEFTFFSYMLALITVFR